LEGTDDQLHRACLPIMNGPQMKASLVTNEIENHAAVAVIHIDFSLIKKVQPPSE
jgi:hypothetical protein